MEFDLLLVHARIADVFRYRLFEGWIGIRDGRFITVEAGPSARRLSSVTRMKSAMLQARTV